MIHELLFALAGSPDSLGLFHVGGNKHVLSNAHLSIAEKDLIQRILLIADQYMTLNAFISIHLHRNKAQELSNDYSYEKLSTLDRDLSDQTNGSLVGSQHPGLYLLALCSALDKALNPYRNNIADLETEALVDFASVSFTRIVSEVEKYTDLFKVLHRITTKIEIHHVRGCKLLDLLYEHLSSEPHNALQVLYSLLRECHVVLVSQLSKWLLLGHLVDAHHELFIVHESRDRPSSDMECTNATDFTELTDSRAASKTSALDSISREYSVRYEMLPCYIQESVAEKILYSGKMIMFFREDPKNITTLGQERNAKHLVWGDKEAEYFIRLRDITKADKFDMTKFEILVDEIRATVVERTWQHLVVDTNLLEEFTLIKDLFLLGRGELFLEFLYKTDGIRKQPCQKLEMGRNCQEAFLLAAHQVLYTNENAFKKFAIHFPFEGYTGVDRDMFKDKDGWWQTINLKYTPSWPMHLIFQPRVLENYNKLFNFLMRVKKAQRDLNEVWFDNKQNKAKLFSTCISAGIWQLRNNLMFMVNNLQYYLQVDVFECQFTKLQNMIKKSQDFEELIKAHNEFQANIMSQTFLLKREPNEDGTFSNVTNEIQLPIIQSNPMHDNLMGLLLLADKFCKVVSSLSVNQTALHELVEEYELTISFLWVYMECLQKHPSGVFVSQLYLRLNYNGWFSNTLKTGVTIIK